MIKEPKQLNKLIGKTIFCFAFLFLLIQSTASVFALESAKSGLDTAAKCGFGNCGAASVSETGITTSLPQALGRTIGVVLSFVGALFMILMIYGGLLWMTARGNEQQVTKAKDLITAALVGIVIVFSAYAITNYVGTQLANPR